MAILKFVSSGINPTDREIIGREINYLTNKSANPHQLYGGYNFVMGNPEQIMYQFYSVNNLIHKDHITVRHFVLSFDLFTEYFVSPNHAALIANRFCSDTLWDDYQILYGIHDDTANLHIHFIVNTVNFRNGYLLPWNYTMEHEIYNTIKLILQLNCSWHGKYPIKNIEAHYN